MSIRLMDPTSWIGRGTIDQLPTILDRQQADRVLLVTGNRSYTTSGARPLVEAALGNRPVRRFHEFDPNPRLEDLERGLECLDRFDANLILAVGGGSVLDMAKLIGICSRQQAEPADIARGTAQITTDSLPLVAVPTTSGSGSESTHFAVVYVNGHKHSVAHPSIRPSAIVVDAALTDSLPPPLTAVTGLDAFCQAVESFWSVHSTKATRYWSARAIELTLDSLARAVHAPDDAARDALAEASHLAGRAINVSKTTAPHAISYTMTSRFGVPHGQAVAVTLGELLVFNSQVTTDDVTDPRGVHHVRRTIEELNMLLGTANAEASRQRIQGLITSVGLATRLTPLGIRRPEDHRLLLDNLNAERLKNNPRALRNDQLAPILQRIA